MTFSVTKLDGELVRPCEPTPSGTLPLSSMDRGGPPGAFVETVHVFEHGREPAKVIRQALSKALVPYYPMAGRLVKSEHSGEAQVACTGDGVWFVEATANCSLEDVNWLGDHPPMIPMDQLLPRPLDPTGMIMMMQVTQFTCGGFIVCFISDHIIADGLGVVQFLNAVAEFARGLEVPKVKPVWCRDAIPEPPKPRSGPPPALPVVSFQYLSMDVSLDQINGLKDQFLGQTGCRCSTFDLLCAVAWQCRTRAINLEPDDDVQLAFAANVRHLLNQVLPPEGGYYGNCVYPVTVTAPSGQIAGASIVEIVSLIRDAKEKIPVEFTKWAKGDFKEEPYRPACNYQSMFVSDWSRLGFNEVDYGWGKPTNVTPLLSTDAACVCLLVKPPAPKKGVRLIAQCVKKEHLAVFQDEIVKFAG